MTDLPSNVRCEVCESLVEIDDDGGAGMVIEFYNLTPEYVEYYGFCRSHKPDDDDLSEVKDRINRGVPPVIPE